MSEILNPGKPSPVYDPENLHFTPSGWSLGVAFICGFMIGIALHALRNR